MFVTLGTWQLERAALKQSIRDLYEQRLALDYRPLDPSAAREAIEYSKLNLRGRYDNAHSFLLDNQIYEGKAGYQVLTPLLLADSDDVVLVNRGWAEWGARRELPDEIPAPPATEWIAGIAFYPGEAPIQFGRVELSGQWPQLISRLDMESLRAQYSEKLLPFVLWLAPEQPGYFERAWKPIWLPPEKSRAYALQWFAFAAIAVVLFIVLNLRKVE